MQILGLYYDRPYLRLAIISTKRKLNKVQFVTSWIPNPPEEGSGALRFGDIQLELNAAADDSKKPFNTENSHVKQLDMPKKSSRIATAIPTLVRHLEFKLPSSKQIKKILPFQIEAITSIRFEDLIYTADMRKTETGIDSTIFFATKEYLKHSLETWKSFSWMPDLVTSTATALTRFAELRCPDLSNAILVDLGSQEWTCVYIENGQIGKAFTLDEGVEPLLSALWEDRKKILLPKELKRVAKQIDLMQLKSHLNSHLSNRLLKVRNKLNNVLFALRQKEHNTTRVLFTGQIDSFGHFREYLLDNSKEFILYDPPQQISIDEYKCALAIGSAIEYSTPQQKRSQFLQGEFIPEKSWKFAGLWGICLLLCSFLCSGILTSYGFNQFQKEKQEIANSFKQMIEHTDKNMATHLFSTDIEEGIEKAIAAIQAHRKESPYLPQTPTVSEVLVWLSSHPVLTAINNSFSIINFKYELISFPHIGTMSDPYRGKIDLEFQVKSPIHARKFHEALLQGDAMVDPSEEIGWEASSDSYHVSFYLKNRVFHVY